MDFSPKHPISFSHLYFIHPISIRISPTCTVFQLNSFQLNLKNIFFWISQRIFNFSFCTGKKENKFSVFRPIKPILKSIFNFYAIILIFMQYTVLYFWCDAKIFWTWNFQRKSKFFFSILKEMNKNWEIKKNFLLCFNNVQQQATKNNTCSTTSDKKYFLRSFKKLKSSGKSWKIEKKKFA